MKEKIKGTRLIILAIFLIGGVIGVMYGIFTGTYCYCEGIMLVKNVFTMFLSGGFFLMMILAALAIVAALFEALLKIFKK